MISVSEIRKVVEQTASVFQRRSRRARLAAREDLVQEGWAIALKALPLASRPGVRTGAYLARAIILSLSHASDRWNERDLGERVDLNLERLADPSPLAAALMIGRSELNALIAALSDLDREIVRQLIGLDGPAVSAQEIARTSHVPVGRVYQARVDLVRRAERARRAA